MPAKGFTIGLARLDGWPPANKPARSAA